MIHWTLHPDSIALSPTSLVPSQLPLEVQESETMTVKDVSSCSSKVTFAEEKVASLLEFGPAITVPQGSRVLSPGAPCLPWQTHSTRRSFPELALLSTSEASLKQFPEMSFTSATEERVLLDANNNLNCEEPPSAKRLCMSFQRSSRQTACDVSQRFVTYISRKTTSSNCFFSTSPHPSYKQFTVAEVHAGIQNSFFECVT